MVIYCQKINYPVSDIPDSLMRNAKAVVRNHSVKFSLNKYHNTTHQVTKATTILNKTGNEYAKGVFGYDKDNTITYVLARLYNKDGELFKTLYRKDFKDFSYDPYGTIYNDSRYLYLLGETNNYPYTIEYTVKYSSNVSFSFPSWYPVDEYNQSVQQSSYEIQVPKGYKVNIKEVRLSEKGKIIHDDNYSSYSWKLENYLAEDYEPYAPSIRDRSPHVIVCPSDFEFDDYEGNMNSWRDFGLFIRDLNTGRDELSEETKQLVKEITSNLDNDFDKARALYSYMQENTRYVSIQVGLGGYQPFPAKVVDEYGYGDCKALTNYMMSLLKEAGIKSYYALVQAGPKRYSLESDIVYNPFNHAILNLPLAEDTIWIECTSQIIPFGFLGDFTDNRYALVIYDEGGILKKTTKYGKDENVKITKANVSLNTIGEGRANIVSTYAGLEYDNIAYLLNADYDSRKDYLYDKEHIDLPDFKLLSFEYEDNKAVNPVAHEHLDLELINYAAQSGNRLFVPLNLMNRYDDTPRKDLNRKNPIRIYNEFVHYDTINYEIPEGYSIEHLPKSDTIQSDFGYLSYDVSMVANQIHYARKFEVYRDEYPKERYDEFVSFCRKLKKADTQKIVLVKEE